MTDALAGPHVQFNVGQVRAALWKDPLQTSEDGDGHYYLTLEREHHSLKGTKEYTSLLEATDIAKAVLALKKADAYLKTQDGSRNEPVQDPDLPKFPQRIP